MDTGDDGDELCQKQDDKGSKKGSVRLARGFRQFYFLPRRVRNIYEG